MDGAGIALVVRQVFLPMTVLALLTSIAWRFIGDRRRRTTLQILASILFFAPQVAVLCLWHQSILLVLHQEAVASLWILGMAIVMWRRAVFLWRGRVVPLRPRQIHSPIVMSIAAIAFTGFAFLICRSFLLDAFAARTSVDGPVEQLWIATGPRHVSVNRYIVVHAERFEVTADVFKQLRQGDMIRGAAGIGSQTLVALYEIRKT